MLGFRLNPSQQSFLTEGAERAAARIEKTRAHQAGPKQPVKRGAPHRIGCHTIIF
jgi:hypothetical protein